MRKRTKWIIASVTLTVIAALVVVAGYTLPIGQYETISREPVTDGQPPTTDFANIHEEAMPHPYQCLSLAGSPNNAHMTPQDCHSDTATFRIQSRTDKPDQCPTDIDYRYYNSAHNPPTYCLDYNWQPDTCIHVDGAVSRSGVCTPGTGMYKPIKILHGIRDSAECYPDDAIDHESRRFTVCVAKI